MMTRVDVLGVSLDIISRKELTGYIDDYLTNDSLNIILTATAKMLEIASSDKEYAGIINNADFVLPGSESVLSMYETDYLAAEDIIVNYDYLDAIFEHIHGKKWTMYLICRNEQECNLLNNYFNQESPNLVIVGTYCDGLEQKEEQVVNEINSVTPDIILSAVDSPEQERWIMAHNTNLNAKLYIGIGNAINNLLIQIKDVPKIVKAMNLEDMYRKIQKNKSMKESRETRIIQKKIADYKHKKGDNRDGDTE